MPRLAFSMFYLLLLTSTAIAADPLSIRIDNEQFQGNWLIIVSRQNGMIIYGVKIDEGACEALIKYGPDEKINESTLRRCEIPGYAGDRQLAGGYMDMNCWHRGWQIDIGERLDVAMADPNKPFLEWSGFFPNPCDREIVSIEILTNKGLFSYAPN